MNEYRDFRDIQDMAVDVARTMDEKTFLTMCQAYMMENMVKEISIELIPPEFGAKDHSCYIKYQILPFKDSDREA